jgi:hypothetical protein
MPGAWPPAVEQAGCRERWQRAAPGPWRRRWRGWLRRLGWSTG